jgi:REP element-mobilizing transposase RayT
MLIGLRPAMALADLVRDVKNNSSAFINDQNWLQGNFNWQEGYGAFSYGHSQMETVYQYILNQEKHHHQKTFREEYIQLLEKFQMDYQDRYLFKWVDTD